MFRKFCDELPDDMSHFDKTVLFGETLQNDNLELKKSIRDKHRLKEIRNCINEHIRRLTQLENEINDYLERLRLIEESIEFNFDDN